MPRPSIWSLSMCAAATLASAIFLSRLLKRRVVVEVSRETFVRVMKELSEEVFNILFEYAQMSVRVEAASGHRDPFDSIKKMKENDPHLRSILRNVQDVILSSYGMNEDSLIAYQNRCSKSDPEIRDLVQVIPNMFNAYTGGDFPTLAEPIWRRPSLSDEELLIDLKTYFDSRIEAMGKGKLESEFESPLPVNVKSLVGYRVNESPSFRQKLFAIVMETQSAIRSKLQ